MSLGLYRGTNGLTAGYTLVCFTQTLAQGFIVSVEEINALSVSMLPQLDTTGRWGHLWTN